MLDRPMNNENIEKKDRRKKPKKNRHMQNEI